MWKQRIMKGRGDNPKTGKRVGLWKDGVCKEWLVARLVALTWVSGYSPNLTVNHINGNRFDNRIINLEWLSLADNIRAGFDTGLYPTKPVMIINKSDNSANTFRSMASASVAMGKYTGYVSGMLLKGVSETPDYKIVPVLRW